MCRFAFIFSPYFIFPLIITYLVVIGRIFGSLISNIRSLNTHLLVLRDTNQDIDSPSQYKSKLFRSLQIALFVYLVVLLIYWSLLIIGIFKNQKLVNVDLIWLRYIIEEFLEYSLVISIGFIIRLRNTNISSLQNQSPFESKSIDEKEPIIIIETRYGNHKTNSIATAIH